MRHPIFVRPLRYDEHIPIRAGLRSSDAFTLRRCLIVPANARGERVPHIARIAPFQPGTRPGWVNLFRPGT